MFSLIFSRDVCKGCELCISLCPKHILVLDSEPNAKGYMPAMCKDEAQCIGCASCAKICPDSAIEIVEVE
ncbi:MAG: 4Fe-4S binding protein [Firmicutes bacterium]|nr:4Fe-4S binding protein [Bacillota bacterium]